MDATLRVRLADRLGKQIGIATEVFNRSQCNGIHPLFDRDVTCRRKASNPMGECGDELAEPGRRQRSIDPSISLSQIRVVIFRTQHYLERSGASHEPREVLGGAAAGQSPDIYTELGSLLADAEALRATGYRALNNELAGRPSPEADVLKLLGSLTLQRVWELSGVAAGPRSASDPDLLFERQDALAATIYGGTSEVQRNIIAERLLGLPKG